MRPNTLIHTLLPSRRNRLNYIFRVIEGALHGTVRAAGIASPGTTQKPKSKTAMQKGDDPMAEDKSLIRRGVVNREKVRAVHTRVRNTHAKDPKNAVFGTRGRIRRIDGFLLEGETGEPAHNTRYVLQQDLPLSDGGQGRAPSALAYMLMGVGF